MSRCLARLGFLPLSLLAVALGFAPGALAEDPPFSDLPPFLLERLSRGGTLEDFLKVLTQEMQRADLDDNGLDHQDIDIAEQLQAAQYRATMLQKVVVYDLDG